MNDKMKDAYKSIWTITETNGDFAEKRVVEGPQKLENVVTLDDLIHMYSGMGIQATKLHEASSIIDQMLQWKFERFIGNDSIQHTQLPGYESVNRTGCTIFLSYTSNMISSGVREVIRSLAEHHMIDCIVTSAGGVEEDFIKCLENFAIGDFDLDGAMLRKQGVNRIGNILDWLIPILDKMKEDKLSWTPSEIINRLGMEINDTRSVYYWAYKNNIPVFCPALTDGSLGDILYFYSYRNAPGIELNILPDQTRINNLAVYAHRTGMIILGGGVSKHQVCNANLELKHDLYSTAIVTSNFLEKILLYEITSF